MDNTIANLYNFKYSQVSKKEKKEIENIIVRYCEGLLDKTDTTAVKKLNDGITVIVALARKHHIPLLTYLIDVYGRMMVEYWLKHNDQFNPQYFVEQYELTKKLGNKSTKSNSLYDIIKHAVPTFLRRMFSFPSIATTGDKIDDNLNEFIEITTQINSILRKIVIYLIYLLKLFISSYIFYNVLYI